MLNIVDSKKEDGEVILMKDVEPLQVGTIVDDSGICKGDIVM